ncbi:MAG: serine protease, partial [Leptospira sp.]|nr:serine protease [Leptospira sp.]
MQNLLTVNFIFLCLFSLTLSCSAKSLKAETSGTEATTPGKENYQLQLKITFQDPDFRTPWRKKNPSIRFGLGSYIGEDLLLVPASLLSNHTLIEVRSVEESSAKTAELVRLDYESDLAIIRVLNPDNIFLNIEVSEFPNSILNKIESHALSLGGNGELKYSAGKVENLSMGHYPEARVDLPYLEFNSNEKLSGNGEMVISTNGKIIGLLHDFNSGTGKGKIIPSQIIHHFIKEKQLFPFKGFLYRPISDKTTLKYYGLEGGDTGVLITDILIDSSAHGVLEIEDILTKVGDFAVDGKGRIDHPAYGKISFAYLFHSG